MRSIHKRSACCLKFTLGFAPGISSGTYRLAKELQTSQFLSFRISSCNETLFKHLTTCPSIPHKRSQNAGLIPATSKISSPGRRSLATDHLLATSETYLISRQCEKYRRPQLSLRGQPIRLLVTLENRRNLAANHHALIGRTIYFIAVAEDISRNDW
jgi:hypothetical protein